MGGHIIKFRDGEGRCGRYCLLLEISCTFGYRGFESHPLRQKTQSASGFCRLQAFSFYCTFGIFREFSPEIGSSLLKFLRFELWICSWRILKVIPFTDVFLYDIKTMDSALHQKYTGVSNELILENLKYIDSLGCQTEIRVPCVPNINDSEIEKINAFVATLKNSVRTRILEYHDLARSKYKALDIPYTLPEK